MKKIKVLSILAVCLMAVSPVLADDFDDFDSESSSSGSGSSAPQFTIGGEAKIAPRLYVADEDQSDWKEKTMSVVPQVKLNLGYETDCTEFKGTLAFNSQILNGYYEDILSEFTARVYLGNWIIEGGKEKVVWGKGDKLHVLDNFNANDYTDFIVPEYVDRRISEPLIKIVYNSPLSNNLRIEGIWAPIMTPDRLGTGRWTPDASASLKSSLTSAVSQTATGLITAATMQAAAAGTSLDPSFTPVLLSRANSFADNVYPDTKSIQYSQAGIRITGTAGSWDLGGSYYYGHYKTVSVDTAKVSTAIKNYLSTGSLSEDDKFLAYDRLQVFGFEAAKVFGPINSRMEFAYYMTDDLKGTDASVKNNSLNWIAGFDVDLPIHNINLNIQNQGKYILNNSDINDNPNDTEYDKDGIYSNNKIVLNISDSYNYEKIKPSVIILYGVERNDFIIQPKFVYAVKPGFELSAQGMILLNFGDKDKSEFQSWIKRNNSFVQIGVKYSF